MQLRKRPKRNNSKKNKAELDDYLKRKRSYDKNIFTAYVVIWEQSANAIHNKVMERSNYESSRYNKTIALLLAVKEHVLNYQEIRYDMTIISDSLRAVLS